MTFGQPVVPRLHASIDRAFGLSDRVEGEAQPCEFSIRSNQYRAHPKGQRIYGSQQKLGVTPVSGLRRTDPPVEVGLECPINRLDTP